MCFIFGAEVSTGELNTDEILNELQKYSKEKDQTIQLFDARYIFGSDHLLTAAEHAKRAFAQDCSRSDSLAMEILLYASGEYQIKNAITKLGVRGETKQLAFVLLGATGDHDANAEEFLKSLSVVGITLSRNDNVLKGDMSTLEKFGISQEELSAVPEEQWFELVLERVAMVDIKK
jgi:KEOPS complex subunit Cgi121